jgi:hypothetical protein
MKKDHPARFLFDVITAIGPHVHYGLNHQLPKFYFNLENTCKYHDHGSEKPCYKTKLAFRF